MYGFDMPEGMSSADFRAHPLTQLLQGAAARDKLGLPSIAELDVLKLPPAQRRKVAKATRDVALLFQGGDQQDARNLADARAAAILAELAPEFREPGYLDEPDPTDGLDAGQLADLVTTNANAGSLR